MYLVSFTYTCFQHASMLQHVSVLHSLLQLNNSPLYRCTTFVYLLISWWTFKWLLLLDYYEYSWSEYSFTSTCVTDIISALLHTPWNGIVGPQGISMFSNLRKCHTVFHSSYIILDSRQQCVRVLISPYSCQHIFVCVFYDRYTIWCEMVFHCDFYLYFSNN